MSDRGSARRIRLLAALALLTALYPATTISQAGAAKDQKVWHALTEEDRRGQPHPSASGAGAALSSRDTGLVHLVAGIAVAVCAGIGVAVFASTRRPRPAPPAPAPAAPEPGSEIEQLWRSHLDRKKRS